MLLESEPECLCDTAFAGVWLLARCADLQAMHYDVTMFWTTIRVLGYIGLGFRLLASMSLLLLNRDKQL